MYRQLERLPAIGVCGSILFGLLLYILAVPCGRLDAAAPGTPVRTVVQAGHNIDVVSVAFARDEKIFASVDSFGRIRVWQLPQGRLLNSWKTNPGKGTDGLEASTVIAFDDEGRLVAIARNILTRWDPETGKQAEKTQLPFDGDAEFRLSSSGTVLAAWDSTMSPGNDPVKVSIWDVRKGIATGFITCARAGDVLLSPSGGVIACFHRSSKAYSLELYNTGKGSLVRSRPFDAGGKGASGWNALALSGDGSLIVLRQDGTGGKPAGTSLEVRHTSDMSLVTTLPVTRTGLPCFFSEDGKYFVYLDRSADRRTEKITVLGTGDWRVVYEGKSGTGTSLAISPASRYIAEGAGGMMGSGAYYLTYLITLHDLDTRSGRAIYEEGKWTDHLAISPDGASIVLNEQRGMPDNPREEDIVLSRLRLVSLRDGTTIWEKPTEEGDRFKNMGYSQDGKYLIARDFENIYIWEMPGGRQTGKFKVPYDKFNTGLAINPDGRVFAAVDGSNPLKPVTYVFRASDGRRFMALQRNATGVKTTTTEALAFSPDGHYIAKTVFTDLSTGAAKDPPHQQQVFVELWNAGGKDTVRTIDAGRYSEGESPRSLDRKPLATDILAFSLDGSHLLVGRKVFRLADARQVADIETPSDLTSLGSFYTGAGRSLSISPGGGVYAEHTQDGIRIMDLAKGRERATIFTFPASSVTVTPEGFFSGSGGFDREVHYVRGTNIYDFNQFYDVFYRPDLVMMKLKGEDISGYSAGLSIEEALRNPAPGVSILSPVSGAKVDGRHLSIKVRVSDTGGGIGDVRVFNNGKLVHSRGIYRIAAPAATAEGTRGTGAPNPYRIAARGAATVSARLSADRQGIEIDKAPPRSGTQELSYDIELIRGENTISLAAFNGPNTIMSSLKTVTIGADVPERKPRLFALVIGNDHFRNREIDLSFAVKDAKDFATLIRKASRTLFEKVSVEVLTDASKLQFLKSLNRMVRGVHPEDVFLFYAASHGVAQDDLYYLFTSGFDGTTLDGETSISSVELMEFSRTIPSLRQIYLLDTCQAGGAGAFVLGLYDSRISVLARALGMHILAGSKTYQQAIDNYGGNGFFTHFLLKAFAGKADLNSDGKVSIMEVNPYLLRSMKAASQGKQEPLIRNFGRDFPVTGVK